jgi:hypothetical protein
MSLIGEKRRQARACANCGHDRTDHPQLGSCFAKGNALDRRCTCIGWKPPLDETLGNDKPGNDRPQRDAQAPVDQGDSAGSRLRAHAPARGPKEAGILSAAANITSRFIRQSLDVTFALYLIHDPEGTQQSFLDWVSDEYNVKSAYCAPDEDQPT